MKKHIRLTASALSFALALSLAACGGGTAEESDYTIGICNYVSDASLDQIVENMEARLEEIQEERGVTIRILYDNCNADAAVLSQIIQNFKSGHVDLMVGVATPVAVAMQGATMDSGIPVVFSAVSDPVGAKLVESLNAPGGNLTGTSDYLDTNAVMELIFSLDPEADRIGLLYDPGQDSSTAAIAHAREYLDGKGIAYVERTGTTTDEVMLAAQTLVRDGVDAVAVSYAPGLIGAVLVGVNFAKSAALALGVPLIPVHHIRAHIAANYITHPDLEPPFVCLCVSGGNTLIADVRDYTDMAVLGATRDDAAGECFDKAARVLGIGYPGGGPMDRLAQGGYDKRYDLPRSHVEGCPLDMSFSGLKTAVLNLLHNAQQKGEELNGPDLAASFQRAVSDILVPRAMEAVRRTGYRKLAVAGGVGANSRIRADLQKACDREEISLYMPKLSLCGDNGTMVGSQGYYEYLSGHVAGSDLNAYANRDLSLG